MNKMGVNLLYYRIWIQDVYWLGPLTLGSYRKTTSQIQMLLASDFDYNVYLTDVLDRGVGCIDDGHFIVFVLGFWWHCWGTCSR